MEITFVFQVWYTDLRNSFQIFNTRNIKVIYWFFKHLTVENRVVALYILYDMAEGGMKLIDE